MSQKQKKGAIGFTMSGCKIRDLSICYHEATILDRLSLDIPKGETVALVGESGSGKSTVAKAIMGLIPYQSGSIVFEEGWEVGTPHFYQQVQMVFQDPTRSFNPHKTIRQGLIESYLLRKQKVSDLELASLLNQVFLSKKYLQAYPHQLSGGQMQRVALARALSMRPQMLLLDEPTSSLDFVMKGALLQLLQKIKKKFNLTILLITHELHLAELVADSACVLKEGKVIEKGSIKNIFQQSKEAYTNKLIESSFNLINKK